MSTQLAQAAGGFHDDVPGCEDWDFWVRLAQRSPLVYLDRPLAAWRMWEGQGSTDARMMLRSANRVRTKYFPDPGLSTVRQRPDSRWASAARRYLSGRDRAQAFKHFVQLGWVSRAPANLFMPPWPWSSRPSPSSLS